MAEAISSGSGSELDGLFQRANQQLGEAGRRVVRFTGLGDLKRAILKSTDKVSTPADHMRRTLADLEKTTGQAFDSVLQAHSDGLAVLNSERCRAQIAAAVGLLDAADRIA